MRKLIISAMFILTTLLLISCSTGGSRANMLKVDTDEQKADDLLEDVIDAIERQDKEALIEIFSKQAINDTTDSASSAENLFDFFQGDVESWEKSSGPTVYESTNNGSNIKEVSSYYFVNTDKQKYFFLLRDYPADAENPDNVGLYMLLVVKAEDREKIYDGSQKILYDGEQKLSHAGIYLPLE